LERVAGFGTVAMSLLWKLRIRLRGDQIQPRTIVTRYRRRATVIPALRGLQDSLSNEMSAEELPPAAAAVSRGG
jgi:hypothetical protein